MASTKSSAKECGSTPLPMVCRTTSCVQFWWIRAERYGQAVVEDWRGLMEPGSQHSHVPTGLVATLSDRSWNRRRLPPGEPGLMLSLPPNSGSEHPPGSRTFREVTLRTFLRTRIPLKTSSARSHKKMMEVYGLVCTEKA